MIAKLDAAIKAVCPIHGVSIGRLTDKSTWRIDFKPEATDQQRLDAQNTLLAFVYTPDDPSDLERLEKAVKVSMLLTRQYANQLKAGTYVLKTIADTKADVKAIWDSLP